MTEAPRWEPYRSIPHYLSPRESLRPPIWRELRARAERTDAEPVPAPAPPRAGAAVLVIPGFGAADDAFAGWRDWLASAGWSAYPAGLPGRKRCGSVESEEVLDRLRQVAAAAGGPVVLVGHSRGGQLAKAVAVRDPDLVAGVVAVGSPLTNPFGTHLAVRALTLWLSWRTRYAGGDFVRECATGECCRGFHDAVLGRLPADLPLWSVASESDGIVLPETTRDPQARLLWVDCTHAGMPRSPAVRRALAQALADPRIAARLGAATPPEGIA